MIVDCGSSSEVAVAVH